MIISFKHRGLRIFYESGSTKGIRADHAKRLARMLSFMDRASEPADLDIPGWRLHPLKADLEEFWSLTVNGNWRVIFRFVGSDIELVDYLDYH
ncbi:Endoribonuclease HigB [Pseudomonas sp. Bi70]|uniref:type II toxin-antitoxin system RelE/ParE family toxin n=1 Tax=Pseudomonas sp. Bi70 TaxID=2821127 RepID=UPI001D863F6D|nr:type II toxin-antitoxin system RelE/ParE family toxin [Pseudomonas sp. Bi70]CAH0209477.1 Endoribonuclease HigB [Pseudomonas sp. Bi70]